MSEGTYAKVAQIADELLGKEGMHKYPFLLVIGDLRDFGVSVFDHGLIAG